ncbi:MAG TPA: NAD-dependent epimerase/dehydratase family protein, partial [Nitrospiraceae bacterium]|nr:NAD-dependent epimerase/dehydratase family protein [Nitrospiraceae bacterium]
MKPSVTAHHHGVQWVTMNIVIAGGSGFIGRPLCRSLIQEGHRVTVLSRSPREAACVLDSRVNT